MAATLTPDQRRARLDTIAAMLDAGRTRREIADTLGVHVKSIHRTLAYDPELRARWHDLPRARPPRPTRTDLDDIRHLADYGYNVDAIAHRLGVNPDSIKRRLQRRQEWALLDSIRTNHQPGRDIYRTRSAA